MLSIQLNNLSFFAYHGLYDEEKISGNDFVVNVLIHFHPQHKVDSIDQTIDYVSVYELIEKRMQIATPLLETIVMDLSSLILERFVIAEFVSIELTKQKPPIHNFKGTVSVKYELKRNH